jgi:ATP-binding cassette subfamily F protein 3
VHIGYFSQDASTLNLDLSPMMYLHEVLGMDIPSARNLLGRFLLTGDDATRPMRTLSGGERNKVQLAALTADSPNVLILDEPTNHLDMASREALAEVLREFNGALILVSHDRWLLDQVTEKTLDVQPGRITDYGGPYGEYRRWKDKRASAPEPKRAGPAVVEAPTPTLSPRELSKEISRREKELLALEDQIARQEASLANVEGRMATPGPQDDLVALSLEHTTLNSQLHQLMADWESQGNELEALRAQRA